MNRYILLKGVQGIIKDGSTRIRLSNNKLTPYKSISVPCGELVIIAKEDDHYELWSDRNVLFYSRKKDNLAPLVSQNDFLLMEGIKMPLDRLKAFKGNKLEFGNTIDVGSKVYIHLQEPSSYNCVRVVVRYKGRVGDLPGILFGVEITSKKYRSVEFTDGSYLSKKYFECRSGRGLFVSLDKLSSKFTLRADSPEAPKLEESCDNVASKSSQEKQTPSCSKAKESSDDSVPFRYQVGDRVLFRSKTGKRYCGSVQWTGKTEGVPCNLVEIKTAARVFPTDFEKSVVGKEEHFRSTNSLVIPEALVNFELPGAEGMTLTILAKDGSTGRDLPHNQPHNHANNPLQCHDLGTTEASGGEISTSQQKECLVLQEKCEELNDIIREKKNTIREQKKIIQEKEDVIQGSSDRIEELERRIAEKGDLKYTQIQFSMGDDESWNISRAEVNRLPKEKIGSGAWGEVYSGKFRGERVAIKHAHRQILHETTINMLKREIAIMAHIQHPNLVRFVAAVVDDAVERGEDTPIIISELLDMNLREAYSKVRLGRNHISIFCDIAYALHYLHQHCEPIIHRDVSAPNVLLESLPNGIYRAKVSDFGSANLAKQSVTAGAGAIAYSAPEMFPQGDFSSLPLPQTTKVDVFSYGVLLLEVILKEIPTTNTRSFMLKRAEKVSKKMYDIIVLCTRKLPEARPTMAFILNELNRFFH